MKTQKSTQWTKRENREKRRERERQEEESHTHTHTPWFEKKKKTTKETNSYLIASDSGVMGTWDFKRCRVRSQSGEVPFNNNDHARVCMVHQGRKRGEERCWLKGEDGDDDDDGGRVRPKSLFFFFLVHLRMELTFLLFKVVTHIHTRVCMFFLKQDWARSFKECKEKTKVTQKKKKNMPHKREYIYIALLLKKNNIHWDIVYLHL